MFRKLNERNQITLPADLLDTIGIEKGDFFEITAEAGKIILQPRQMTAKPYPDADWAALQLHIHEQTARGEYTEYSTPAAAKKHLRKLKP